MSMTRPQGRKQPTPQGITTVVGNVTVHATTCPIQQAKFARRISDWCDGVEARVEREKAEAAHAAD